VTLPLELPEIETIRRDLDREIAGKKIKSVEVSSMSIVEGFKNKKAFNSEIVGTKLGLVERKGLHIFTELDKNTVYKTRNRSVDKKARHKR
jgi:formamidopyrimidine-DNA glycosylase